MWRRRATLCLLALVVQATQMTAGRKVLGEAGPVRSAAATAAAAAVTLPAAALSGDATDAGSSGSTEVELKIINGNDVTTGDFNFMAALYQNGRFFCGGALLDNTTVLTAAHCLVDTGIIYAPESLTVWSMGSYSPQTIPEDNEDLTFNGQLHDIGVIKLEPPGISGSPPSVLLPTAGAPLEPGERLQVSGWGTTEDGVPSNVLQYAVVAYLPAYNCPSHYEDVVCAGGTGQNTCNGDSGGPLLVRDPATRSATVVGVTSHGPECLAGPDYAYGYYTDVRQYLDAITAWQQGQEYVWAGDGASDGSSSGVDTGSTPEPTPELAPDPIVWQPVPGWDWDTSTTSTTLTWQELFCLVFGC